jgi:hypothetical protein
MPQDSGPESKKDAGLSAAAARIMDDVRAEPVPESIIDLAKELDRTLRAKQHKAAASRD